MNDFHLKLRQWAKKLNVNSQVLSLALGLSFVLSTGPIIQNYIFAVMNTDASSIYGSSYQQSLVRFPSLQKWLLSGLYWPYALMGLSIAAFTLRDPRPRQIWRYSAISSFVILNIADIIIAVVTDKFNAPFLFQNSVANAVGAGLLGLALVAIFGLCQQVFRYMAVHRSHQRATAGMIMVAAGVLASTAIYYSAAFFYQPLPVVVDVHLDYPGQGIFMAKESADVAADVDMKKVEASEGSDGGSDEETAVELDAPLEPFRLVPRNVQGTNAKWTGPQPDLRISWSKGKSTGSFTASLSLYDGCLGLTELPMSSDPLVLSDIGELAVWFDGTMSDLEVAGENHDYTFDFRGPEISMFHMTPDDKADTVSIQQFLAEKATLQIRSDEESFRYFLASPAVRDESKSIKRKLHIQTDRQAFIVDLPRQRRKEETCVAVPTISAATAGKPSTEFGFMAGVNVQINETSSVMPPRSDRNLSEMSAIGHEGWLTVGGISKAALENAQAGTASFLVFYGSARHLEIDQQQKTLRPFDSYSVFGELTASFESAGTLRFTGPARAVWRDQSRVNLTRWETLGTTAKLSVAGFVFGVLAALVSLAKAPLNTNRSFKWLSV